MAKLKKIPYESFCQCQLTANRSWSLHQLDVKKTFLHGHLHELVSIRPPPEFRAQGEKGKFEGEKKARYGLIYISPRLLRRGSRYEVWL